MFHKKPTSLHQGAHLERDGRFWVEHLPLADGSMALSLTATDRWGNLATTNFSVSRSALGLTVQAIDPTLLAQSTISVSGTVSDSSYNVQVNGVEATVNGSSWQASGVPVGNGGTATFEVVAYPPGQGPPNAAAPRFKVDEDAPDRLYVEKDEQMLLSSDHFREDVYADSSLAGDPDWVERQESLWQGHLWRDGQPSSGWWSRGQSSQSRDEPESFNVCNAQITWPASDWPALNPSTWAVNAECVEVRFPENPPRIGLEWCEVNDPKTTAWGPAEVLYWGRWYGCWVVGWERQGYVRHARTKMKLFTGGKAIPHRMNLFALSASATEITDKRAVPPWIGVTGQRPIPSGAVFVGELGSLGSDGRLYTVLPDGVTKDVTPRVAGKSFYTFQLSHTKHKLMHQTQCVALTNTNLDRTQLGVGEEVNLYFDPAPLDTAYWINLGGGSISPVSRIANNIWFTAPSNAATVELIASFPGAALTNKFTVVEPSGFDGMRTVAAGGWPFQPVQAAAGMNLRVVMAPTTVSFYKVQVLEVGQPATDVTGWFSVYGAPPHDSAHRANQWYQLGCNNAWDREDSAVGKDYLPPWTGTWGSGGGFTWNIPFAWKVGTGRAHTNASGWDQKFTLEGDGTVTVRKFGYKTTRAATGSLSIVSKEQ